MPPRRRYRRRRTFKRRSTNAAAIRYRARRRVVYRRRRAFQRRRGRAVIRVNRSINGWIPDRIRVKLRTFFEFNGPISSGNAIVFARGNSFLRETSSGEKRAAAYFSLYQNSYQNYIVHGSSVRCAFRSANVTPTGITVGGTQFNTNSPNNVKAYLFPGRSPSPVASHDDNNITELPHLVRAEHVPYHGRAFTRMRHYMTSKKLFGLPRVDVGHTNPELGALTSRPGFEHEPEIPSRFWNWYLVLHNHDVSPEYTPVPGSMPMYINVRMHITYYVEFYNRRIGDFRGLIPDPDQ